MIFPPNKNRMVYFLSKNSAISKKKNRDAGKWRKSYVILGKKRDPFEKGMGNKIGLLAKIFTPEKLKNLALFVSGLFCPLSCRENILRKSSTVTREDGFMPLDFKKSESTKFFLEIAFYIFCRGL